MTKHAYRQLLLRTHAPTTGVGFWLERHRSAMFIVGLFVVSVLLMALGTWIRERFPGTSIVMMQLAGALLAAGIATVFLTFRDVIEQISSTMASLFEGKLASFLAPTAQDKLLEHLTLSKIQSQVESLDNRLYEHCRESMETCLSELHVENMSFQVHLTDNADDPELLDAHSITSFLLKAGHLSGKRRVPYRMERCFSLPPDRRIEDPVPYFRATFDGQVFEKDAAELKVDRSESGEVRVSFRPILEIKDEMRARIEMKSFRIRADDVFANRAQFPTRGLDVQITYPGDFAYECVWFYKGVGESNEDSARVDHFKMGNTVTARTSGWLVPGQGVMIHYMPSENRG